MSKLSYSERLKKCRNKRKLTQEQLSSLLKFNRSTYAKYETGENQPDYDTLQKLADFFEVSTDYLLGRTDDPSSSKNDLPDELKDPEANIFFKDYLSAPKEKQEELKRFWEYIKQAEKDRKPGDKQGDS